METTGFADRNGKELFLGSVVRTQVEEPFQSLHGTWADYEITKGAGGYILSYFRSETGCQLPFGYTSTFMNQFHCDDLPLKQLIWSTKPIRHPALKLVADEMSPDERRDLFSVESRKRRESSAR